MTTKSTSQMKTVSKVLMSSKGGELQNGKSQAEDDDLGFTMIMSNDHTDKFSQKKYIKNSDKLADTQLDRLVG